MDGLKARMQIIRNAFEEKNFWLSAKLKKDFADLAKVALKRYGKNFDVLIELIFEDSQDIAYTTFRKICINANCKHVQQETTMEKKFLYVKGLLAHELSHILYMNKKDDDEYAKDMLNGEWKPKTASAKVLKDIEEKMSLVTNRKILVNFARELTNILEDGYGERTFISSCYGSLVEGMKYMRSRFFLEINSVDEIQEVWENESKLSAVLKALLLYSLYGETKDMSRPLDSIEDFKRCQSVVDRYMNTHKFKNRLLLADEIIVIYWDYIKELMVTEEQEKESQKALEELRELLQDICQRPTRGSGTGTPVIVQMDGNNTAPSADQGGQPQSHASSEINQIMNQIVEEMAQQQLLSEQEASLQSFVDSYNEECVPIEINRVQEVSERMIKEYGDFKDVLTVSKRMQRLVMQKIKDMRRGGKQSNLYLGRRIETRNLIRNDGKYFYNNMLPKTTPRICVYVIIDESGSMSCKDGEKTRIEYAKQTAVILEDFCNSLEIPLEIIGHYAQGEKVIFDVFTTFEKVDKKDKYRIMDANACGCNRDGTALRYGYKRLQQREEEIKMLFIISDGRPSARGYSGNPAKKDMQEIKKENDRKGILTFAAAIGSDKEIIEEIYGDSFLDISDLETMPRIFTDKILKYLRK